MNCDHAERFLEAMLPEAIDADRPPDLADEVAGAPDSERAAAAERVEQACPKSHTSHRWLVAAVVLLGGLAVAGIALFGGAGARPEEAMQPGDRRPQDRPYSVPKDATEFLGMLDRVESITVRALYLGPGSKPSPSVDLTPARGAAIQLPNDKRDEAIACMRAAAKAANAANAANAARTAKAAKTGKAPEKQKRVRARFLDPDVRIVLHLRDGRRVRCVMRSMSKAWSVLADRDLDDGDVLFKAMGLAYVQSYMKACHSLGIVNSPIQLQAPRVTRFDAGLGQVMLLDSFGDGDLVLLKYFTDLRRLDLSRSRVSHLAFRDWSDDLKETLDGLEVLVLGRRPVDDKAVAFLARHLPKLTTLDLSPPEPRPGAILKGAGPTQNGTVTGAGFRAFARHTRLHTIKLGGQRSLTDAGLAEVVAIPGLRHLDLSFVEASPLTRKGYECLRRAVQLRTLRLSRRTLSTLPPAFRTGDLLPFLDALPRLEELSLKDSNATDKGMSHLRTLPSLVRLDLAYCREIGDATLAHVRKRFAGLREIDLRGALRLTADGIAGFAGMKELRIVRLSRSTFSKADVAKLEAALGNRLHWDR